ncbi:hypothetical protein DAPPUDRAFT_265157 [Daphnia pulex]|uniref:Uncharacterized protein n=1 Tax=Daphnia pulex TaxID=6669 RepID=E9HSZ0_DAPPU|nr:hypothetical protein DAPPUDRAFT_265157 [Daphnia pulex]|eukprot:EFX65137.1 hypothetical protein DAPPUDRAFT_265157 [Daphnia pulex]
MMTLTYVKRWWYCDGQPDSPRRLIVSRLAGNLAKVTLCLVDNKKLLKRFSGEFIFSFKSKNSSDAHLVPPHIWCIDLAFELESKSGHRAYCTKLPRNRNSPISRAVQAAGHEARRNEKREAQIAERREVEARFLAENQQEARDAAERKKAAIEEAKRIWRQLIAEKKKKTPVQPSSSQQLAIDPNSRDQEDEFILQISEELPEQ